MHKNTPLSDGPVADILIQPHFLVEVFKLDELGVFDCATNCNYLLISTFKKRGVDFSAPSTFSISGLQLFFTDTVGPAARLTEAIVYCPLSMNGRG